MIRINASWGVRTDDNCCSLIRIRTVGEGERGRAAKTENLGKEREQVVGYYANLVQSLQAFLDKASREEADTQSLVIGQLVQIWERNMELIRERFGRA